MMWGLIPFLLLMATMSSCSLGGFLARSNQVQVFDAAELSRAIIVYSEKMAYENRLRLEDSVVYYNRRINRIRLDYSSMDNLDLWQARALLVDLVEGFIATMNSNGNIFPHLAQLPMKPENLEIYITFESYYNAYVDLQTVGLITLRDGIVNYFASDALDCDTQCWHRRSEYYFQSKNFIDAKREGEALYRPKVDDLRGRSAFGDERYLSNERYRDDERFLTLDIPG